MSRLSVVLLATLLVATVPAQAQTTQGGPASSGSSGIVVGTTAITNNTPGDVLYDQNGVVGESSALTFNTSTGVLNSVAIGGDTSLSRLGAGNLMLSDSTTATKLTVSSTTDSLTSRTNYANAYLQAGINAGEFDLGSEHGGTGTALTKFGLYVDGTLKLDYGITTSGAVSIPIISGTALLIGTSAAGAGNFVPGQDGTGDVGTSALRWASVLAFTSIAVKGDNGTFQLGQNLDITLSRAGAAALQFGAADAASPVAQTLQAQSVVAGNANTAGATFTIAGSKSNGSGGGDMVFKTTLSSAASGSQNTLATALTLKGGTQAAIFAGQITLASSTTGAGTETFTNSPCSGLTTEQWVPVGITGQTGTWYVPACQ